MVGTIGAHYLAKTRSREDHERTLDLLVTQDERRTATRIREAAREFNVAIANHAIAWPELHNGWLDRISADSRLVQDPELWARADAGLYIIAAYWFDIDTRGGIDNPSPGGTSTQKSLIATMCGPSCAIVPVTSVSPPRVWMCTRIRLA